MKVEIELDNLNELVQKTIERDAENVIRNQVVEMAHKQIDNIARQVVEDIVSEQFQHMVNDYINQKVFPGCQIIVAVDGQVFLNRQYGYFEYDSKKSGGLTKSHLRFSSKPIRSPP